MEQLTETSPTRVGDLFSALRRHLSTWPAERVHSAGFGLLLDPTMDALRMTQARRVLVSEHVLESVAKHDRPPMVVLKGIEVASLYPTVVDRPFRDVDALVVDPHGLWSELSGSGFVAHPARRFDIDHHHLPPLADPSGTIGVELHHRPNVPRWARLPVDLIVSTAQPSRTRIPHVLRPRDDVHALLMALHGWKGGFTKMRDLFDALLLAEVSTVPVERTAAELGLTRFWRWTRRLADQELFGRSSPGAARVADLLIPRTPGLAHRNRSRVLAPYLVANPARVTAAHARDVQLGRAARRVH